MQYNAKLIADQLLQIKAIKLSPQNPFTWASGIHSPIYCDNRIALSFPESRDIIIHGFIDQIQQLHTKPDLIAGVATAGIPHAAIIADRLKLPMIYVRSNAKKHGRQNLIEGQYSPKQKVLVIEDLISTAGSSIKAVQQLRNAHLNTIGLMAIFTYGFPVAEQNIQKANLNLYTLTNLNILIQQALQHNYISNDELHIIQKFVTNQNPLTPLNS